ncbi:hypothetical protein CPC698_1166A, partial [Chlamydia psittaci C6/98]
MGKTEISSAENC